jgi:hypothetical protein
MRLMRSRRCSMQRRDRSGGSCSRGKRDLMINPALSSWVYPSVPLPRRLSAPQGLPSLIPSLFRGWRALRLWETTPDVVPAPAPLPISTCSSAHCPGCPSSCFSPPYATPGPCINSPGPFAMVPARSGSRDRSRSIPVGSSTWRVLMNFRCVFPLYFYISL